MDNRYGCHDFRLGVRGSAVRVFGHPPHMMVQMLSQTSERLLFQLLMITSIRYPLYLFCSLLSGASLYAGCLTEFIDIYTCICAWKLNVIISMNKHVVPGLFYILCGISDT